MRIARHAFLSFRSLVLPILVLVAQVAFSAALQAQDAGRPDRSFHGHNGHGKGIGAGVGVGVGIIHELMSKPRMGTGGSGTSRNTIRRARKPAKKGNDGETARVPKEQTPDKSGEIPVTNFRPNLKDPADGIAVTGGTVHRGTGDYGDRQAIVCWLDPSANAPCTKFAWYQFYCVQVATDLRDGKGPQDQTKKATHTGSFLTSTGSYLKFGEWGADDYIKTKGNRREFPSTEGTPCPAPPEGRPS